MSNKYAVPGKVAINGASNGGKCQIILFFIYIMTLWAGLLVATCINRAPEGTFSAAVAEVGVLNMLKVSTLLCAWLYYGQNENTTSGFQP